MKKSWFWDWVYVLSGLLGPLSILGLVVTWQLNGGYPFLMGLFGSMSVMTLTITPQVTLDVVRHGVHNDRGHLR